MGYFTLGSCVDLSCSFFYVATLFASVAAVSGLPVALDAVVDRLLSPYSCLPPSHTSPDGRKKNVIQLLNSL